MRINWHRIMELRSELGDDSVDEIVDAFLEEVADAIGQIDPNAALDTLESDMHFVKSSALNLGFAGLAELCHEGERLAASGARPIDQIAGISHEFEACKAEYSGGRDAIVASA